MKLKYTHKQELDSSAIAERIQTLNFRSVEGDQALQAVFGYCDIPRLTKRVHPDAQARVLQKKYQHIVAGGWYVAGLDPTTDWQTPMTWGRFKPDLPRRDWQKPQKIIKYESPPGEPARIVYFAVDCETGRRIARRYHKEREYLEHLARQGISPTDNLADIEDKNFWQWIRNTPEIALYITEGEKKAAAILSLGFCAIAIPGIWMGTRKCEEEAGAKHRLHPDLAPLVASCRRWVIVFDYEPVVRKAAAIAKATEKLGEAIAQHSENSVDVVNLPGEEKGIDDWIVARGDSAAAEIETLFDSAVSLSQYRAVVQARLTCFKLFRDADLKLNQRYLGNVEYPDGGLIAVKSPKGTGKTSALSLPIARAIASGRKTIVIGHRIQLVRAICAALGISYVEEQDATGTWWIGLCVDSCHRNSRAQFNPEDWKGAIVIIDEADQVFWHLLNSGTLAKRQKGEEKRVVVMRNFRRLLQVVATSGGSIIVQSADLSDRDIDFANDQLELPLKPWILVNDWQNPADLSKCYFYDYTNPGIVLEQIFRAIDEIVFERQCDRHGAASDLASRTACCPIADRPISRGAIGIVCDGQKTKSTWGTKNLEKTIRGYINEKYPDEKFPSLRLDSESISDPDHPAYGAIEKLNDLIPLFPITIASPSIGTGVSIDVRDRFRAIFGIFQGVNSESESRQHLARFRDPCDRHVWCAKRGVSKIGNGALDYRQLIRSTDRVARKNIEMLRDLDFDIDGAYDPKNLRAWAQYGAQINAGLIRFRESVLAGLENEGHDVRVIQPISNKHQPDIARLNADKLIASQMGDRAWLTEISEELSTLKDEIEAERSQIKQLCDRVRAIRDEARAEDDRAVAAAADIDWETFSLLEEKSSQTEEERWQKRKYILREKYGGIEVNEQLNHNDEDGWYSQIKLHYLLMVAESAIVAERDRAHVQAKLDGGEGELCLSDLRFYQAKIELLKKMGIPDLLDGRELHNDSPEVRRMSDIVLGDPCGCRDFLNFYPTEKVWLDKPIQGIQQQILASLGIRLEGSRKQVLDIKEVTLPQPPPPFQLKRIQKLKPKKKRIRIYRYKRPDDRRWEVFERWLERDREALIKQEVQKADRARELAPWKAGIEDVGEWFRESLDTPDPTKTLQELRCLIPIEIVRESLARLGYDLQARILELAPRGFLIPHAAMP